MQIVKKKWINKTPWTKTILGLFYGDVVHFIHYLHFSQQPVQFDIVSQSPYVVIADEETKEFLRIKCLLYYYTFLPAQIIGFVLALRSVVFQPQCTCTVLSKVAI